VWSFVATKKKKPPQAAFCCRVPPKKNPTRADNGDLRPLAVKVGDTVVFGQYAGSNTIEIDGEELIIMGESEIFAVVD
jgi:co-chaperonin GroES (HSP10)